MTRLLVGALVIYLLGFSANPAVSQALPQVVFQTQFGDIEVEIDTVRAPVTGANFLRYVDHGFYRASHFYRTFDIIQGGIDSVQEKSFPPIELEPTNVTKLRHLDGTLSMARARRNSATSEFFICVGDNHSFDYRNEQRPGYAAFGRVVRGMEVVRKIQAAPAEGQKLSPPVRIRNIVRKR